MSDTVSWIQDELEALKSQGLFTTIRTLSSPQGAWLEVDERRVLNLCSNNYLGLADHPRMKEAAQRAIQTHGVGPGAVRTIAGTMDLHIELERRLAAFKEVAATISFQSGFNANLAVIPALVDREDVIFSDELNHASIIDGCRLARARTVRYRHSDADDLRKVVRDTQAEGYRRALLVTDGVFSMDGDVAPLDRIVDAADDEHDAVFQQPRVDVVGALAASRLLDDHGNQI